LPRNPGEAETDAAALWRRYRRHEPPLAADLDGTARNESGTETIR
jgi:hypothetical protein